jgi:hypothetical protein
LADEPFRAVWPAVGIDDAADDDELDIGAFARIEQFFDIGRAEAAASASLSK